MRTRISLLIIAGLFTLSACATSPTTPRANFDFPQHSSASKRAAAWLAGNPDAFSDPTFSPALSNDSRANSPADFTAESRFLATEIAYWEGDVELVWHLTISMLRDFPNHPLNRQAAARLYDIQNEVVDFHARTQKAFETIDWHTENPITRTYLAQVAHVVALQQWRISNDEKPFAPDQLGRANSWRITPSMSPWRLLDFEKPFAPEKHAHLQDRYLSPAIAIDHPENHKRTTTYTSTGINLAPQPGRAGIYYLETFVTVASSTEDTTTPTFWATGNFPSAATVWIGDQQVFHRVEDGYDTNKRLRHVQLTPGTHRILIKLAYQPGYRDWFDFSLLPDNASTKLSFSTTPPAKKLATETSVSVTLLSPSHTPSELETLIVDPKHAPRASDIQLYLTALTAFQNGDSDIFDAAYNVLIERHPNFAPAHALKSAQLQTRWDVPGDLRDPAALSELRTAYELRPESLYTQIRLGRWLQNRGNDREVRELLEAARDAAFTNSGATLKNVEPLYAWAQFLDTNGWSESAEQAWRTVLDAAPTHCLAAANLQNLYYTRHYFPALADITPAHNACPNLVERENDQRPDRAKQRLATAKRNAARFPDNPDQQLNYARELIANNQNDQAEQLLKDTLKRSPEAVQIWAELATFTLGTRGKSAASNVLQQAMDENQHSGWLVWQQAILDGKLPLQDLMPDGYAAAMADVQSNNATTDDAYYVLDFAARRYFPDGASITLTHTVARVMTRGAIDRYAETEIPSNARVLLARTIKKDGSIRVPEEVAGKETLSMPALAEGDLVEIAYLQFNAAPEIATHIEDIRFYFRMLDISTVHSEYIVLGSDDLNFMLQNDAPKPQAFQHNGVPGLRFVARNNPRPRNEPNTVSGLEFLPWIQGYRTGITTDEFDANRRYFTDIILDSTRPSDRLRQQVETWLPNTSSKETKTYTNEDIKKLFSAAAAWIPEPNPGAITTDATHALLSRRGSPLILLKTALDIAQIPAEIYLVESKFQIPEVFPIGEFAKYNQPLLKVQGADKKTIWLDPSGPDAMYEAIDASLLGQPAVCVTCPELVRESIPQQATFPATRNVDIDAKLDPNGTLTGRATYTFTGTRAANVRAALRARADDTNRQKYLEAILADLFSGSTLLASTIDDEHEPQKPLTLNLDFERPAFARPTTTGLQIETNLFREALATIYTQLPTRTLGLFVGYERAHTYSMRLTLPKSDSNSPATITSQTGTWTHESPFGTFASTVELHGNTLHVDSNLTLPIQRIATTSYPEFQRWATAVERSATLFLQIK